MKLLGINTKILNHQEELVRLTVMVVETSTQSMAWMEHGLQTSLRRYALSMEDKMAAEAFGRATNYG